jgi:hypothetical protein
MLHLVRQVKELFRGKERRFAPPSRGKRRDAIFRVR